MKNYYPYILFIVIGVILSFKYINYKLTPVMIDVAQIESEKLVTDLVTSSIKENVVDKITFDKLFITTNINNVSQTDFDTIVVNKILTSVTEQIQDKLKNMDNDIITEIPIGLAYNNILITNLSPKIPVRMHLIGSITSKLNNKITNYGINNALLETNIIVTINIQIILPFKTKNMDIATTYPIAIKLITGNIPNFYSTGSNSFSIPIE